MKNNFNILFALCFGVATIQSCSNSSTPCQTQNGSSVTVQSSELCLQSLCGGAYVATLELPNGFPAGFNINSDTYGVYNQNQSSPIGTLTHQGTNSQGIHQFRWCFSPPAIDPFHFQFDLGGGISNCQSEPFDFPQAVSNSVLEVYVTGNDDLSKPTNPNSHKLCFGDASDPVLDIRASQGIINYQIIYTPFLSNGSLGNPVQKSFQYTNSTSDGLVKLSDEFSIANHSGMNNGTKFRINIIADKCDATSVNQIYDVSIEIGCTTIEPSISITPKKM